MADVSPAGWSHRTLGRDVVAVHCGRLAFDLDLGEWECAVCDVVAHVRDIPGWPNRRAAPLPAGPEWTPDA